MPRNLLNVFRLVGHGYCWVTVTLYGRILTPLARSRCPKYLISEATKTYLSEIKVNRYLEPAQNFAHVKRVLFGERRIKHQIIQEFENKVTLNIDEKFVDHFA